MNFLLKISHGIDRLSEIIGACAGWLILLMVLIGAYNAVVRYLGRFLSWNLSSNAYLELQWYLFSLAFLLGGAYALRRGAHVRVDVLYGRVSERVKAWINLVGTLIFLLPFCIFSLWVSWPSVRNSWAIREISSDPDGLPRYPIKAMILVGFSLLILQAISEIIKQVAILRGVEPGDRAHNDEAHNDEAHDPGGSAGTPRPGVLDGTQPQPEGRGSVLWAGQDPWTGGSGRASRPGEIFV